MEGRAIALALDHEELGRAQGGARRAPRRGAHHPRARRLLEAGRTSGAWRSTCRAAPAAARARSPARRRTTSPSSARSRCSAAARCTGSASTATSTGPAEDPKSVTQPVACLHCETAPCEYVCPVNATVHSRRGPERDGLQPLRRHAVLLQQLPVQGAPLQLLRLPRRTWRRRSQMLMNPDVTVRARGVMEKCTYCVQRIERARIDARVGRAEDRAGRGRAGLPAGLPDRGHRRSATSTTRSRACRAARRRAPLRPAPRARHPAAHRLPRHASATRTRSWHEHRREARHRRRARRSSRAPVLAGRPADRAAHREPARARPRAAAQGLVVLLVALLGGRRACWLVSLVTTLLAASASGATTSRSAGPSTSSTSSGGSASATPARSSRAILLLFQQKWRTSINRFAEAMTIFAVMLRGHLPADPHRPPLVRLLALPVPVHASASGRKFKSPLAVGRVRHLHLLHRLAALLVPRPHPRPRHPARRRQEPRRGASSTASSRSAGAARRGTGTHYRVGYLLLAGLSTPLVLSVHTIVSLRLRRCRSCPAGTPPSSRRTSSPAPIFCGFAMVLTLHDPGAPALRPPERRHRRGTSTTWPR